MPEENKKQTQKNKNENSKDQRKKRQNRQPPVDDKKVEKEVKIKDPEKKNKNENTIPQVTELPPEFYQNLKRETDEILKITEETDSKYKKKEILSNWAKYEMPIESYEEMEEQESAGADFESLIQASLSVGGHFQFKHEKSWDATTGPSPHDKWFNINMENLNLALSTIPFYDRNNINTSLFSESDIKTMNHRAAKYKQKYYKDKMYTTPETEAQDTILRNLIESDAKVNRNVNSNNIQISENICDNAPDVKTPIQHKVMPDIKQDTSLHNLEDKSTIETSKESTCIEPVHEKEAIERKTEFNKDPILNIPSNKEISKEETNQPQVEDPIPVEKACLKELEHENEKSNNPVIESPEDLEKWLDDFLNG